MTQSPTQQWQFNLVTLQLSQEVCKMTSGASLQWVYFFLGDAFLAIHMFTITMIIVVLS